MYRYVIWQSPKQKRPSDEILREGCTCVEENIVEHEVTEGKGFGQGADARLESTRPKSHTHTRAHSEIKSFVSLSSPKDVHTFTHTQGSSYLPAYVSLHICGSLVFWVRQEHCLNVFTSVTWWSRATDSMSDDDDYDGQDWAKLAGYMKGIFSLELTNFC